MSLEWYRDMFNNTNTESTFDVFKTDFDSYAIMPKKALKQELHKRNITFSTKDATSSNKLAFLLCGGIDTRHARQKPGPSAGSTRIKKTVVNNSLPSSLNLERVERKKIKRVSFDRNALISLLTKRGIICEYKSDTELVDIFVLQVFQ